MARFKSVFRKDFLLILCLLLWKGVAPSAITESQGSLKEKEVANNQNAKSIAEENHSADKFSENQNTLRENKNNNYVGAADNGYYNKQDGNKKVYDDSKFRGGQTFNQDFGERDEGTFNKKGHKKGHHNRGFHNSYHKDESSNNSSYFDDFNDEADQHNSQQGRGKYGNEAADRYNTRSEDGQKQMYDNARQGNYDRRGGTEAKNVDHQDFNRNRYHDDRRDHSHHGKDQSYGGRDRGYYRSEMTPRYHEQPYYQHDFHHQRPPMDYHHREYYDESRHSGRPISRRNDYRDEQRSQKITIYEDPRITNPYQGRGALRDETRLDVRPGGQRFQRYDSYYEPRPRWGVNRRSDINPLVFNYKRY